MDRLNNEVISQFKRDFITSNNMGTTLLILLALYKEDYDFLDQLDDSNKDKKMILLYRDLVYKGYLQENEDNDDSTNVHFSLTKKAKELIENDGVIEEVKIIKHDEIAKEYVEKAELVIENEIKPISSDNVESWIKDWLMLWPARRADNYPLRTGSAVVTTKMNIFLKNNKQYGFTKKIIFEATKLYLEDQERDGWRFTQIAGNFISKAESGRGSIRNSTLETYCNLVISEDRESKGSELEDNNPWL